jgi:hypothetical protein
MDTQRPAPLVPLAILAIAAALALGGADGGMGDDAGPGDPDDAGSLEDGGAPQGDGGVDGGWIEGSYHVEACSCDTPGRPARAPGAPISRLAEALWVPSGRASAR